MRESFRTLALEFLKEHEAILKKIFERITLKDEMGNTRYDNLYDHESIRSLIRRAFVPKRDFLVKEEVVPCEASLLQIEKLVSPISVQDDKPFFPSQDIVKTIVDWDTNAQNKVLSPEELALIEKMKKMGYTVPEPTDPHPERKQTHRFVPVPWPYRRRQDRACQNAGRGAV